MEANDFILNLKADHTEKDNYHLPQVASEYKTILINLPAKDRGQFSINVLRTLCWNIQKSPLWCDGVDNEALLALTIDCARETRAMDRDDRVKTLSYIYHLHRYAVGLKKPVPPELVLKISYLPFELDSKHLLQYYNKTYWNILADRLSYIERLKSKVNIVKLLPKLTEDIAKVIQIYNTVQFCLTILVFLIKKMYLLYNEKYAKELSQTYGQIFTELSKKEDLKLFKKLSEKENLDVYVKINECLYVVIENASKIHFKDCVLDDIVQTCISFVGHSPDLLHCMQTFYQNSFCSILSVNGSVNLIYTETVLGSLDKSLETTAKLGYTKALHRTYPYLSQLLRLYIEYNIANCTTKPWKEYFSIQIQETCLKLILCFMEKLKNCEQLLKCDNCSVKTGLHDSLRLSLLIKHFVTISLSQTILITTILDTYYKIIIEQYMVVTELKNQRCVNYMKFFRKLQTDIHNTAITLNKTQHYEFSIKLFDIYLKHELKYSEMDFKNISRALYNKSICELDCMMYENALIDAFLSLTFSKQEGLNSDKYMSLVMDIKAKELKSKSNDEVLSDALQLVSVLNACKIALERKLYGDLMSFMSELNFSILLKHEFMMYSKLWPSIAPIGGVWQSLLDLTKGNLEDWITVEQEDVVQVLYEVILETPSVVRTVHSEYFSGIVKELLDKLGNASDLTTDLQVIRSALLFLQFEFDLAAASQKYGWKCTEPLQSMDPDQILANRTIPQEHSATTRAIVAVRLLDDMLPIIGKANATFLRPALQLYQVFVPLLFHLSRDIEALTLAYVCCHIAEIIGDDEAYITNAGILLSSISVPLEEVTSRAVKICASREDENALVFICDAAIHYNSVGEVGTSARLIQLAQVTILRALTLQPELNLDLALGRLLEAQTLLCDDSGLTCLTAVTNTQRHYLALTTTGTRWSDRRSRSLRTRVLSCRWSRVLCHVSRSLRVRARARAAAAVSLAPAAAVSRAALYAEIVDVGRFDDAQIKIDNRLKHALGLQPSNEIQPYYISESKQPNFTQKQEIEAMRDNMVLKMGQISPSQPCISVPEFKIPDFFHHDPKCTCYACEIPLTIVLACQTSGLEASMYAKANETQIARNYFEGVLDLIKITDKKLVDLTKKYKETYKGFIVDSVMKRYGSEFKTCQVEILIELCFFELKNRNYVTADEHIVKIHEVVQDMGTVDRYLSNEIANLMIAAPQLKKTIKKPQDIDLDEFESLRLSPMKFTEPPKTPVNKPLQPPKPATKIIVKDEELPKKRRVIKIDFNDDDKDFEKPIRKLTRAVKKGFKIPNPTTTKAALEMATPRTTRSVPKIIIDQPSDDMATPVQLNKPKSEFFTPFESIPEQFFTPMTSVKTYSKKTLRQNIVKNLERDFSTPKVSKSLEKENKTEKKILQKK